MKRRFTDAPTELRCKATTTLRDKSTAQCGRYAKVDGLCRQHKKIAEKGAVKIPASVAAQLHKRLLALGCNVGLPKRIWLGRAHDNSDLWRWEAAERISGGISFIGCECSMSECLKMSDDRLKFYLDA